MKPETESKAQGPDTADHLYDAPDLSPVQFLAAVMHDPRAPVVVRMEAAERLLKLLAHLPANMHSAYLRGELDTTIRIEGFTLQ